MIDLKTIAVAASALAAFVGGVLFIDERFAHAADLEHYQRKQTTDLRIQLATLRGQGLEDKLFELETKPVKTVHDNALISRYKRQLEEVKKAK